MKFPEFIVIGAMKSGTTSLYNYLKKHPEIHMAASKELNYFMTSINYQKGDEWYKNKFNSRKLSGEVSPGYSKYEKTAELIYDKIPNCKFIYIVRDPVERIISHMNHLEIRPEDLSDSKTQWRHKNYIQTSMYYLQISRYLKYFDLSQFCFLTLENLKKSPLEEMNKLFRFLSVSEMKEVDLFKTVHHKTTEKQSITKIGKKTKYAKNVLKQIFPESLYLKIKRSGFVKKIFFKKKPIPIFDEKLKNDLYEYLYKDTQKFIKLTKINADWTKKFLS